MLPILSDPVGTINQYDAENADFCCAINIAGEVVILNRTFLDAHDLTPPRRERATIEELFAETPLAEIGRIVRNLVAEGRSDTRQLHIDGDYPSRGQSYLMRLHCFSVDGGELFFLYLKRRDEAERRRLFERALFHDVMNSLSGIEGITQLLSMTDGPDEEEEFKSLLLLSVGNLSRQLGYYRTITEAEQGQIEPQAVPCSFSTIFSGAVEAVRSWELTREYKIELWGNPGSSHGTGDPVLIRQVLDNMLRNAVEASPRNGMIRYGITETEDEVEYYVWNAGELPDRISSGIFGLGNSTKSAARGVGTYAMKLIGEEVLGGRVRYTSSVEEGTTFYFSIPRRLPAPEKGYSP